MDIAGWGTSRGTVPEAAHPPVVRRQHRWEHTQGWLRPAADGSGTNVLICDSRGMPVDVREGRRYNKSLFDKVKDVFSVG